MLVDGQYLRNVGYVVADCEDGYPTPQGTVFFVSQRLARSLSKKWLRLADRFLTLLTAQSLLKPPERQENIKTGGICLLGASGSVFRRGFSVRLAASY